MSERHRWVKHLFASLLCAAWARNGAAQSVRPIRRVGLLNTVPAGIAPVQPTVPPVSAGRGTVIEPSEQSSVILTTPVACTDTGTQSCGHGACMVTVPRCQNGRPLACQPNMNQRVPEFCDGIDNDCDGVIDNAPNSRAVRSVCPVAPSCEAIRTIAIGAGAATVPIAPASGRTCAPPFAVTASSHELQVITVATRMVVALSTTTGGVQMLGANRAVINTTDGLCAPGTSAGAAIVEPGTYVLRATGDGVAARRVRVEAAVVPARASAPSVAASGRVTMSTAGAATAPFNCRTDEGVDVRVLMCPRGASAVLSATQGFLASLEGVSGGRTCYTVTSNGSVTAPLPGGSLVIVRVWPRRTERGPALLDLR